MDGPPSEAVRWAWSGEVDLARVADLRRDIEQLPSAVDVELDLSEVTFMDSTGLGLMVLLRNRVLAHGQQLVLAGVPVPVARIMTITGLDKVFVVRDESVPSDTALLDGRRSWDGHR